MRTNQSKKAKGLDKVICPICDHRHRVQSKDLDAHLRSLESKGERTATRQQRQQQTPAPVSDREAVTRLRNMRAAWSHVAAEHMPEDVRQVLGV